MRALKNGEALPLHTSMGLTLGAADIRPRAVVAERKAHIVTPPPAAITEKYTHLKSRETIKSPGWDIAVLGVARPGKTLVSERTREVTAEGEWVVVFVELKNVSDSSLFVHDYGFQIISADSGPDCKSLAEDGGCRHFINGQIEARNVYQQMRGLSILNTGTPDFDKREVEPGATLRTALIYDLPLSGQSLRFGQTNSWVNLGNLRNVPRSPAPPKPSIVKVQPEAPVAIVKLAEEAPRPVPPVVPEVVPTPAPVSKPVEVAPEPVAPVITRVAPTPPLAEIKVPYTPLKLKDALKAEGWDIAVLGAARYGKTLTSEQVSDATAENEWLVLFVELKNSSTRPQFIHDYSFQLLSNGRKLSCKNPLEKGDCRSFISGAGEARKQYQESRGLTVLNTGEPGYDKLAYAPGAVIRTALVYDLSLAVKQLKLGLGESYVDLGNLKNIAPLALPVPAPQAVPEVIAPALPVPEIKVEAVQPVAQPEPVVAPTPVIVPVVEPAPTPAVEPVKIAPVQAEPAQAPVEPIKVEPIKVEPVPTPAPEIKVEVIAAPVVETPPVPSRELMARVQPEPAAVVEPPVVVAPVAPIPQAEPVAAPVIEKVEATPPLVEIKTPYTPLKINGKIKSEAWNVSILGATRYGKTLLSEQVDNATAENEWLVLFVELKNASDLPQYIHDYSFQAITSGRTPGCKTPVEAGCRYTLSGFGQARAQYQTSRGLPVLNSGEPSYDKLAYAPGAVIRTALVYDLALNGKPVKFGLDESFVDIGNLKHVTPLVAPMPVAPPAPEPVAKVEPTPVVEAAPTIQVDPAPAPTEVKDAYAKSHGKSSFKLPGWEVSVIGTAHPGKILKSEGAKEVTAEGEWVVVYAELKNASGTPQYLHDYSFQLRTATAEAGCKDTAEDGTCVFHISGLSETRGLYPQSRDLTVLNSGDPAFDKKAFAPGDIIRTALVYDVASGQTLRFGAEGQFVKLSNGPDVKPATSHASKRKRGK